MGDGRCVALATATSPEPDDEDIHPGRVVPTLV